MEFNDMQEKGNDDETVVSDSNPGQTFWENEFTGKGVDPTELEFAKVVHSDYCSDEQRQELEQIVGPDGETLGSSRIMIKKFAQVGDRLLADRDERENSAGHKFFGKSMDSLEIERTREKNAQALVSKAISEATDEIIKNGRRPLPGRMHK